MSATHQRCLQHQSSHFAIRSSISTFSKSPKSRRMNTLIRASAAPPAECIQLTSLRDFPPAKGALLDQFGVLHDGREPYPGAIEGVEFLYQRGVKLLVLSNSSRRAGGALDNLARMGFPREAFHGVITSGEVTHQSLLHRRTPFWQARKQCLHFTWAARGAISLDGLGIDVTLNPLEADFILAHGTEALGTQISGEDAQPHSLDTLREVLMECSKRNPPPPLVIANPDIVTVHGSELRTMPGTFGKWYAEAGGEVHLMGKPAAVIYEEALRMLDLPREDVVAVGDSLEHDIAGAAGAGIRAIFVAGGIHAKELGVGLPGGSGGKGEEFVNSKAFEQLCSAFEANPEYAMPYFCL